MASAEHDFRKVRFKAPETMDTPWLEWFREEFSHRVFQADVETRTDAPFRLDVTIRQLPDLAVYVGETSPMRWQKNGHEDEGFIISISLAGQFIYKSDSAGVLVEPGAAIIHPRPDTLDMRTSGRQLCIHLSSRLLAPLVPNVADIALTSLPAKAQALRLLTSYLKMLDAEETIDTPEARNIATVHVHDLAALALGTSRDSAIVAQERGGRAARLAAIKQDILSHLADTDLSVSSVAARQGLSPRYIHMLFEQEGMTYSECVVAERLKRAHRMLTDPRHDRHSIGDIALYVGFGDLSYFNRTFRRRFGMTPSGVRAMAQDGDPGAQS